MPKILFLPSGKATEVPPGAALMDALRQAEVEIVTECGGEGTCGTCIVRVVSGEVDAETLGTLPNSAVADGYVLACRTRVLRSPVTVEVAERSACDFKEFAAGDETYLVRSELLPKDWDVNPLAVKWLVQVPAPQPEDGLSDLDRLTRAVECEWGEREVICPLRVLRGLADILRTEAGRVTVTLVHADRRLHITRVEAGDRTTRHYAIAVDVGTTTVAVQLIDLTSGKIMATRGGYNDQIACGIDIISRINYARRPERLEQLRTRVLKTINLLLEQVARSRDVDPREISTGVISANTTMHHLLLGIQPEYIRLAPYTPTVLETPYLNAGDIGIEIDLDSWICFSPNSGSYVGGDITAGLLCTDLATDTEEISLFIDIGTNGELVVGNKDFLMSCACSAGPAFEGGGIECGMRAASGAIERVEVEPVSGVARYGTIGNSSPQGICGSGMIDCLANLFLGGWVNPAGKFERTRSSSHVQVDERCARYVIVPAEESATGKPISISERDIEGIIRAKAAIYSACALMLSRIGIAFDDLKQIYIAGGFGRFLPLEKAVVLGLAPDVPRERFHFLGNASLTGSYMVAVSQDYRQRQLELAHRMTYIDLSNDPAYMGEYMAAMFLPHTDTEKFPTVRPKLTS